MKLPQPDYRYRAIVRRVIDGDTVVVDVDLGWSTWLHGEHIRLLGINAPEIGTPQGPGSCDFLEGLIERYGEPCDGAKAVILESVKDKREKYGRLLGRLLGVHGDGAEVCLNDEMVEAGYAAKL